MTCPSVVGTTSITAVYSPEKYSYNDADTFLQNNYHVKNNVFKDFDVYPRMQF